MNINYPNSPSYINLADLWLLAATAENQDTNTKHNLIETTIELTNRIKNLDGSIPHEEVSHICDRILGQFNKLSPKNQNDIAKYVGTLGNTGYEHLHKLFQTIGDTQHLPNYFAPQQTSPRNLLNAVIDSSRNFFTKKSLPPEGIINLGVKARECVDLSKKSPIYFSYLEKALQDQILSYLNLPSVTLFNSTSKQGIARRVNSGDDRLLHLGIDSCDGLINYLGPNGTHVKNLNTGLFTETFRQPMSKDSLIRMQQAFPNLQELSMYNLDDNAVGALKDFKLLKKLLVEDSLKLTDKTFLVNLSSLINLYLSNTNIEELDAQSLTGLTELKILYCPKLTTIDNSQNLTSLSQLLICGCPEIDLKFLENIPSLRKVSVTYMNNVDLSCLANHPHVEHLYLEYTYIENFDFLFTMPSLKLLECFKSTIPQEKEDELTKKGISIINNS